MLESENSRTRPNAYLFDRLSSNWAPRLTGAAVVNSQEIGGYRA